jgi:hypothetical protein
MNTKLLLIICSVCTVDFDRLEAQGPAGSPPGQLEITAPNGANKDKHLVSINGVVPMVMVRPNQAVPIKLQFPSDKAGTPVAMTPLDGGEVNGGQQAVLPTGQFNFVFKPGTAPGRYRLLVMTPNEHHLLEFYVVDPENPPFRSRASRN